MEAVDYFDAWARWFDGNEVKNLTMGGIQILWWARIGKLMQFAAGLVIVLDLIGPERLAAAARKLGGYEWGVAKAKIGGLRRRYRIRLLTMRVISQEWAAKKTWQESLRPNYPRTSRLGRMYRRPNRTTAEKRLEEARATTQRIKALVGNGFEPVRKVYQRAVVIVAFTLLTPWVLLYALTWDRMMADLTTGIATFFIVAFVLVLYGVLVSETGTPALWLASIIPTVVLGLRNGYALTIFGIARVLTGVIGKRRPGHPLRWFATVLFVCGFHFDLLGS